MAWQINACKGWYCIDARKGISQWNVRTVPAWHHGYTEHWQRVTRHIIVVGGKVFFNDNCGKYMWHLFLEFDKERMCKYI